MTKKEMIDRIAISTFLPKDDCERVIDGFIDEVINSLLNDDKIVIKGFMTMETGRLAERKIYNPNKGKLTIAPAKKTVHCKMSKSIIDILNKEDED